MGAVAAEEKARALTREEMENLIECEEIIQDGFQTFLKVGNALLIVRDRRLYREGFFTFEDYCRDRWGMSKTHANRMISAAEVVNDLAPMGAIPDNERQARPLTKLDSAEERQEAWQEAVETAPEGKVTAAHVQAVVEKRTEPEKPVEKLSESGFDAMSVEATALRALCQTSPRWDVLRKEGATDKELREAISDRLGLGGGSATPGGRIEQHGGGKDPYIRIAKSTDEPEAILRGNELLDMARKVLNIPQKTEQRPATSGLLKKVSDAEPAFTSDNGTITQECLQWLSHRQGNPTTGTVPPPVLIDGEKWVCLTLHRYFSQGRDEARCVHAMLLDDYIDAFHQTPAYVKPLWQSEWQEEVASGKRERENVSYLKVHTNPYMGILVLLPEIKTFTCLRTVQEQPEVDPYEEEEPEEIVTLEDDPEPEAPTSEPQYEAMKYTPPDPNRQAMNRVNDKMSQAYHAGHGCRLEPIEVQVLVMEQMRLIEVAREIKTGLLVSGRDLQLLTALAARKRPGQDAMEPAAYLSMLLNQRAEQAGIELEASDGGE
jgi:3-methyladenine DNA glycosylase Tag